MRSEEMMASDLILEQETQTTALDIHQGNVGNTQDSQNDTSKLSSSSDLKRSYSASWLDVHEQRAKRITPSRDHHEPQEHEKDDHFSGSEQMLKLVHSMVSHNFDNVLDGKSIDGDVVQQAMLLTKDGGASSALKQNLKNPSTFDQPDHHNALVEKMTAEIIQFVSKGKVPELARQLIAASEEQDTSHRSQLVAVQTDLTYLRHIVHQQAFNLQTTMLTMFSEAGKWRQLYDKLKASNCCLQDENKELKLRLVSRNKQDNFGVLEQSEDFQDPTFLLMKWLEAEQREVELGEKIWMLEKAREKAESSLRAATNELKVQRAKTAALQNDLRESKEEADKKLEEKKCLQVVLIERAMTHTSLWVASEKNEKSLLADCQNQIEVSQPNECEVEKH